MRLIGVTVTRWRETTSDVRWSAITIVRHVAPAADASLTSRFITFSALFVAFFVAFPGAAALGHGGHGGRFTVAAVAASAVAAVVVTAAPGLVTVAAARAVAPAATAAMALAVASRWLVTYLGRSTKRFREKTGVCHD